MSVHTLQIRISGNERDAIDGLAHAVHILVGSLPKPANDRPRSFPIERPDGTVIGRAEWREDSHWTD